MGIFSSKKVTEQEAANLATVQACFALYQKYGLRSAIGFKEDRAGLSEMGKYFAADGKFRNVTMASLYPKTELWKTAIGPQQVGAKVCELFYDYKLVPAAPKGSLMPHFMSNMVANGSVVTFTNKFGSFTVEKSGVTCANDDGSSIVDTNAVFFDESGKIVDWMYINTESIAHQMQAAMFS